MSRSNYDDDCDGWALIRWRGAVKAAIRGERGQALLRDLRDALDAMPSKRLIAESLESSGAVCALGALGRTRGIDMAQIDPDDSETVAKKFGIADALAREIVYKNDECSAYKETEAERWIRMRAWVERQIENAKPVHAK